VTKFYGKIGFASYGETSPGIWEERIEERPYRGDVVKSIRRWDKSENIHSDFALNNNFSIVSDAFLYSHLPAIRYVEYLGTKFEVTSAELERPRILLTVGGVYVPGNSPSGTTGETGTDSGNY
jgi:hypothetical protein